MQIKNQYLPEFLYIYKICKSYEMDYTVKNIVEECRKYENIIKSRTTSVRLENRNTTTKPVIPK